MGVFPDTQYSAVVAAKSSDPDERRRSMERLAEAYYRPVYTHLRLRWRRDPDDARDLAQSFFAKAIDQKMFGVYDPTRSRFRTFVRRCLDHFVINDGEAQAAQKRGGGARIVALDSEGSDLEAGLASDADDPEGAFDRELVRQLFARSVAVLGERLSAMGKDRIFRAFSEYDLREQEERPSYAELARGLGVETTTVTNWLHVARKELRAIVLSELRELTTSEEEFRDEALELLHVRV